MATFNTGRIAIQNVTTTWNPASVAAGASVATTVTVNNVKLGDYAIASLDTLGAATNSETCVLNAWVDAADTVRVVLYNGHATNAVDAASGNLRVSVIETP